MISSSPWTVKQRPALVRAAPAGRRSSQSQRPSADHPAASRMLTKFSSVEAPAPAASSVNSGASVYRRPQVEALAPTRSCQPPYGTTRCRSNRLALERPSAARPTSSRLVADFQRCQVLPCGLRKKMDQMQLTCLTGRQAMTTRPTISPDHPLTLPALRSLPPIVRSSHRRLPHQWRGRKLQRWSQNRPPPTIPEHRLERRSALRPPPPQRVRNRTGNRAHSAGACALRRATARTACSRRRTHPACPSC